MLSNQTPDDGKSNQELLQRRFLAAYELTQSIDDAARHAKIPRQTHYDWLEGDSGYRGRFQRARGRANQTLEDEAVRRTLVGIRKPVLYKGRQVRVQGELRYVTEHSDRLLLCLLQAYYPEKFGDPADLIKLFETDPEKLTDRQLDVLVEGFARYSEKLRTAGDNQQKKDASAGVMEMTAPAVATPSA